MLRLIADSTLIENADSFNRSYKAGMKVNKLAKFFDLIKRAKNSLLF